VFDGLGIYVLLFSKKQKDTYLLYIGLSRHYREDNRILETKIIATIVATIVATIKKTAKLVIFKAKFKEINHIF
jgi:hypothetical protein